MAHKGEMITSGPCNSYCGGLASGGQTRCSENVENYITYALLPNSVILEDPYFIMVFDLKMLQHKCEGSCCTVIHAQDFSKAHLLLCKVTADN